MAPELGKRGGQLWTEMTTDASWGPAELVLLEEACRLADRMDRLDSLLSGDIDTWLRLRVDDSGVDVSVQVDSALSEARQHAVAFKAILAELRQGQKAGRGASPAGEKVRAGVTDLSRKIAERRAQAAG